jgi:FAD-dependent oxidoreductase domain-containing protein 1
LIIGAGILGLSCAYHLKINNPGKEILVVDRLSGAAQGNTARSAAMFRNMFTSKDNLMLAQSSINFYLSKQKSGVDLGIRQTGYLWIMSDRQLSINEPHVRKMEQNGTKIERLDRAELQSRLPSLVTEFDSSDEDSKLMRLEGVSGAFFGPECGRLDPEKLAKYYLEEFLRLGGKIAFETSVVRILVEPNESLGVEGEPFVWQESKISGVALEGSMNGEVRAETTVVASGVWNNELLEPIGVDGHVKGKKRQMFTISVGNDTRLDGLMHNRNFNSVGALPFVILPKCGCFIKAVDEERRFWVACDDELNQPYVNVPEPDIGTYRAEPRYYEENVYRILKAYLPDFENHTKPDQMWAGLYSYNTLDSIPFVFTENGLIVAGGGSGSGIMKADAMGRLVDCAYREGEDGEADLYGGIRYRIKRIGFKSREVEKEEWVL